MYGIINMEAILKFDIKSVIKSDMKFDISTKLTTLIGHKGIYRRSSNSTVFGTQKKHRKKRTNGNSYVILEEFLWYKLVI